mmetsp:Transcript_38479/g.123454  ORF Transcript_38479/g.123454 Transcript_38479/m.123454 type:complete len:264 (+) Transcript_38479:763-1554(+)
MQLSSPSTSASFIDGYIDCSSWYTVESSSTCSSCGPEPSGASASTFAETSRSSGDAATPSAGGGGAPSYASPADASKHDLSSAQTRAHVSCEKVAPVSRTSCSRDSAATCERVAWCGCCRQRASSAITSSHSGASRPCCAQNDRSSADSAGTPVSSTHAAWCAVSGGPDSDGAAAKIGRTSSPKARTPSGECSAPPGASSTSAHPKSADSAAARTAGLGCVPTASASDSRSGHHNLSAGPRSSGAGEPPPPSPPAAMTELKSS